MSRGHGTVQRAITAALGDRYGATAWGLSVRDLARAVHGPRYSEAQLRSVRRAVAGLLADGIITETRRAGKYNGVVNGGGRLRVYLLSDAARHRAGAVKPRYPCPGCGRKVMARPAGDERGQGRCTRCLYEAMHEETRRLEHDVRVTLGRDETLKKLVTLALDSGATEEEAAAALLAARKRTAR